MKIKERINKSLQVLSGYVSVTERPIEKVQYLESGYWEGKLPNSSYPWKNFPKNGTFGGKGDAHCFFRFLIDAVQVNEGEYVAVKASTQIGGWAANNPQFAVYIDENIVQGMDTNHCYFLHPQKHAEVIIYAYGGMAIAESLRFDCSIVVCHEATEKLVSLIACSMEAYELLDSESYEADILINLLNETLNELDFHSSNFYDSVENCYKILLGKLNKIGGTAGKVNCVGHTHIDIAWLWTKQQTREKAVRSFATAVHLLENNADFTFFSSQPYLYSVVKQTHPQLFEKIRCFVKSGRWEADGAMWIESDCSLTNGESLIRQIKKGTDFFKNEFGKSGNICWLPDTFGFNAAMPQILKGCGIDAFITSKLSWNDTNRFPFDAFLWEGSDGSQIPAYLITTQQKTKSATVTPTIYVSEASPAQIAGAVARFNPKNSLDEVLLLYGWGDGGGGVTQGMIENVRNAKNGLPGIPQVKFGKASQLVEKLQNACNKKNLPLYRGELYLELHRGTYTSIAKNKNCNRRAEFDLYNIEWLCVLDMLSNKDKNKNQLCFDKLWETVLTNQFHDILPGSSIKEVYDETDKEYLGFFKAISEHENQLIGNINLRLDQLGKSNEKNILVFNPHAFETSEMIMVDGKAVYAENIPPLGYKTIASNNINRASKNRQIQLAENGGSTIENEFYKIVFDDRYVIVSLYDKKRHREVVAEGGGMNKIIAYEDLPYAYDAWEIGDYYTEKCYLPKVISASEIEHENRFGLRVEYEILKSNIVQHIYFYDESPRIDFVTCADWKDENILLRTLFDTNINCDNASFDTPFGITSRPATSNNSIEQAQFEVCAHKYASMYERGFGVAILSDSKYGYSAKNKTLGMSLIKSAVYPYLNADKGKHEFTYSVMTHDGDYAQVNKQALLLNNPIFAVESKGTLNTEFSFVKGIADNVAVSSVKQSFDGKGIVLRLYEFCNSKTDLSLVFGFNIRTAFITNLLEETREAINVSQGNTVKFDILPRKIVTLYLEIVEE